MFAPMHLLAHDPSRRSFVRASLAALAAIAYMDVSLARADGPSFLPPNLAGLLSSEPDSIEGLLAECRLAYPESGWDEFRTSEAISFAGVSGNAELILLGQELAEDRRIDPAKLNGGVYPQAAVFTLRPATSAPSKEAFDASLRMSELMDAFGVSQDQIIARTIASPEEDAPSYLVASGKESGRRLVWTFTLSRSFGLSVGCSFLEYYAKSNLLIDDYDVVASLPGPWDIDVQPRFRPGNAPLDVSVDGAIFSGTLNPAEYSNEALRLITSAYIQEWSSTPTATGYLPVPLAYQDPPLPLDSSIPAC